MNYSNIIFTSLAIVACWFILGFNGLVRRRFRVKEAWSDIEVQLKRRWDLIPNLVETVKGYAQHEQAVFNQVTEARARALNAQSRAEKAQSEEMVSNTLKTLFAVAENYPELKANANFLDLQRELADTENKIQAARRFHNGTVRELNTKIKSFPSNLIAGLFNFKEESFFGTETTETKEAVAVKF